MNFSSLKLSLLLIPLAIGASYLHAQTTPPPGGNIAPPVHTLSGSQVKTSNLSVTGFVAQQQATFKQDTFISGIIKGALTGNSSTVSIGRTVTPVSTYATGTVENKLALGSDKLKNTASRAVCGTNGGEVVLCDQSPICGNNTVESPEQCDDGNTTNGDGCTNSCSIEPAPVDLCPDATNPNPLFQGIQTTLPPGGFIDSNGKCKIRISAGVQYQCSNGGNGRIRLTMNFDRPVPEDMMIYVAKRSDGAYQNCHSGIPGYETSYQPCSYLVTTSSYYNFRFPGPVGDVGQGSYLSLLQGMTTHTTPLPNLSSGPRESNDQATDIACWDNYTNGYKTAAMYFKVGNNDPDIYVTDFRLSNYNSQTPNLQFINQ